MTALNCEKRDILNSECAVQRRDEWFGHLANLFANRSDPYNEKNVFALHGFVSRPAEDELIYTDPEKWVLKCLELCTELPGFDGNRFAPVCVEYPAYGVHFIDKVLGADVFRIDSGCDVQWNASYLKSPVGCLKEPDLENSETWLLAKRAAMAFIEADVSLPLFGMPTLSSPLNILLNLYGQEALFSMIDDPDAVTHDLRIITDVIGFMHKWYREHIPYAQLQPVISWDRTQPPGYGQVCGCTTQLISGKLYRQFIAPLDDELLAIHPNGGMIHLCGSHLQHLECFREMPHLKATQLNDRAALDLPYYVEGLRDDQIIYVSPCPGLSADDIVRITKGERVVIVASIDAPRK